MKKALIFAIFGLLAAVPCLSRGRRGAGLNMQQFVSGLNLEPGLKLEIARLDLTAAASGESPKVAFGVDWGTTKAVVTIPARAHYAVDLSGREPVAFSISQDVVTAVFPEPAVSAVELDPREKRVLIAPGWGRLSALSGEALREELERGLRERVLKDASQPGRLAEARDKARPLLEKLVSDYARKKAVVRFAGEPAA